MVQGARRRQPRIWRRANEALSSPSIPVEVTGKKYTMMKKLLLCCAAVAFAGQAFAQVELKTYADPDGYLERASDDRRQIDVVEVSHRGREAGHVSHLRQALMGSLILLLMWSHSHFCPVCGSTVYYFRASDPARTGVRVGAFADQTFPPPIGSGLEEYRHPWVMNIAALPMPLGHQN
jgi:hypothetical protein